MWLPSLLSVLHDLWRFVWRLDVPSAQPVNAGVIPVVTPPAVRPVMSVVPVPQQVKLRVGEQYTTEAVETILVRRALTNCDAHLVQSGNLTLIEWLLYYVQQQNPSVSLLALRMTPLGMWHQTVKGLPGVRVGVEPTTGSLMEWFDTDRVGRAGVIERMTPDSTLTVRTLSLVPSGTCQEQVYTIAAWKELGAVFTRLRV